MADIVYLVDGYLDAGYFVYTADAGAGLTSRSFVPDDAYIVSGYAVTGYFTVPELVAVRSRSGSLSITAVATTSVTATATKPGTATASTTATLSGTSKRTRSTSVTATATATLTATGRFAQSGASALASTFTAQITATATKPTGATLTAFDSVSVTALANKNFDGNLSSSFVFTVTPSVTRDAGFPTATVTWDSQDSSWDDWQHLYWDPDNGIWIRTTSSLYAFPVVTGNTQFLLPSEFTIYPNGGYALTGSAVLPADSDIQIVPGYVKSGSCEITAQFSITAPGEKQHSTDSATLSTSSSMSTDATIIPPTRGTVAMSSAFVQTTTPGYVLEGNADLASAFAIFAQGKIPGLQDAGASITGRFSTATQANYSVRASSSIAGTFTASINGARTRTTTGSFASEFGIVATSTRTRPGVANNSARFSVTATGINVRPGAATISGEFSVTALAGYRLAGQGAFNCMSSLSGTGSRRRNGTATISSNGFVLVAGDVFTIDPDFQLTVTQETRWYPVLPELRLNSVTQETRVNTIWPEFRAIPVPQETRQETVL